MWYAIFGIIGGAVFLVLAAALARMSRDVTECPKCGSMAELEDIDKDGNPIFVCHNCGMKIKL